MQGMFTGPPPPLWALPGIRGWKMWEAHAKSLQDFGETRLRGRGDGQDGDDGAAVK